MSVAQTDSQQCSIGARPTLPLGVFSGMCLFATLRSLGADKLSLGLIREEEVLGRSVSVLMKRPASRGKP